MKREELAVKKKINGKEESTFEEEKSNAGFGLTNLLAAIGNIFKVKNIWWILLFFVIILIVLFLLSKRKKEKNEEIKK